MLTCCSATACACSRWPTDRRCVRRVGRWGSTTRPTDEKVKPWRLRSPSARVIPDEKSRLLTLGLPRIVCPLRAF